MIEIRLLAPADRASLARLLIEMQAYYRVPSPGAAEIERDLAAPPPGTEIMVAAEGSRILGFAGFATLWPGSRLRPLLFIKEIYITAEHRNAGIGRRLIRRLARLAVERGCNRIDWTADRANMPARGLYEKLGARVLDEKVFFRLDHDRLRQAASEED